MTRFQTILGLLALGALSGCSVGPEPARPETVLDPLDSYRRAAAPVDAALIEVGQWWQGFEDPTLDGLVALALEGNPDLAAATARVVASRARLGQAEAALWPEATLGLGASRQKSSFVLPQAGRVATYSTTYSDDLAVSWQADLFGRLRRGRQAALAEALSQAAGRDALAHSLISEVVRARVRLSTLGRSLDLASSIQESWDRTLATVDRRYRSGLASALDLRLAQENAASAEAAVILLEQQLGQAELALDVLLGRVPGLGPAPESRLAPLPPLIPVPPGLPAELLDRRPDLRQAELRLHAATARVGVAIADLYPSLRLTSSAGTRSDSVGDLLSSEGLVYSVVGSLLGPIFDGGRRRAEVAASRAAREEAAASYAGAILGALREVEDALLREEHLGRRIRVVENRVEEARAADRIARDRYLRGVEPLVRVLETERRMRGAEQALVSAQAESWTARIDLHLALGGDWGVASTEVGRTLDVQTTPAVTPAGLDRTAEATR